MSNNEFFSLQKVESRLLRLLGHAVDVTARNTDRLHTWGSFMTSPRVRSTWSYEEQLSVGVEHGTSIQCLYSVENSSSEDICSRQSCGTGGSVEEHSLRSRSSNVSQDSHPTPVLLTGQTSSLRGSPIKKRRRTNLQHDSERLSSSNGRAYPESCHSTPAAGFNEDIAKSSGIFHSDTAGSSGFSIARYGEDGASGGDDYSDGKPSGGSSASGARSGSSASSEESNSSGSGASGLQRLRQQMQDCKRDMERKQKLFRDGVRCRDRPFRDYSKNSSECDDEHACSSSENRVASSISPRSDDISLRFSRQRRQESVVSPTEGRRRSSR